MVIFDRKDELNEPHKVCNISDKGYIEIIERISIDAVRKDVIENPQTYELETIF